MQFLPHRMYSVGLSDSIQHNRVTFLVYFVTFATQGRVVLRKSKGRTGGYDESRGERPDCKKGR